MARKEKVAKSLVSRFFTSPKKERIKLYKHDCNKCIYLGLYEESSDRHLEIYWCKHPSFSNLDSVIGRYGDGSDYVSSHPPECFADKQHYLRHKNTWYSFALKQAIKHKLYANSHGLVT